MENLCKICGSALDAKTNLCPQCDVVELMRKQNDEKKKKAFITVACVIVVALVVAAIAGVVISKAIKNAEYEKELEAQAQQELIQSYYDSFVGVYEGTYVAGQGETGLTLTVYEENDSYYATFDFYNMEGQWNCEEGKFKMSVSYDEDTDEFVLEPMEWIEEPPTYGMIGLTGKLEGDVFSGSSPYPFNVTRVYEDNVEY